MRFGQVFWCPLPSVGSEKRCRKRTSESESNLEKVVYHLKFDFHDMSLCHALRHLVVYNEGIIICTHVLLDSQVHFGHQQHSGRERDGGRDEWEWGERTALYPGSFLCMVQQEESAWIQG